MEFNEKLQELRKQNGLTQEDLAEKLYVSRTAISKWESGRGYPNIDSLKAIAKFFSVTVDELLSSEEVLTIAEETSKQKEQHIRNVVFGLLDLCVTLMLFLPFFAQRTGNSIQEASLLQLTEASLYLRIAYWISIGGLILFGTLTLSLQCCHKSLWSKYQNGLSLTLNTICVLLFMISLQPYAAIFLFVFLLIKILIIIKT